MRIYTSTQRVWNNFKRTTLSHRCMIWLFPPLSHLLSVLPPVELAYHGQIYEYMCSFTCPPSFIWRRPLPSWSGALWGLFLILCPSELNYKSWGVALNHTVGVRREYVFSCTVQAKYCFVHLIWISASGLPSGSPLSWCTARDRDTTVSNLTCNWRIVSKLNCYWLIIPFDCYTARQRRTAVNSLTCSWRTVSKLKS
jgi:hypothetical protein